MASGTDKTVQERVIALLSADGAGTQSLNAALRLLAKWRSELLGQALLERSGDRVLWGPFKGMAYPVRAAEGARTPRLIGCYEASLVPVIEEIALGGYDRVIDIGSAEGYYAVGLALRLPGARVIARDTDATAQAACAELARINGVAERVEIGGAVNPGDFDGMIAGRTLILCDIEGEEEALLDPDVAPRLREADLLVEVHEGMRPGCLDLLERRFAPSHHIQRFGRRLQDEGMPPWAEKLSDMDRLLLLWEWRASPTPWLWMRRRTA
ncbi:MAG: hypothetical protein O9328_12755 [Rhodobacteraceae bacterium]|nr:hypothetical protein [Paracoccaceae bacterium]